MTRWARYRPQPKPPKALSPGMPLGQRNSERTFPPSFRLDQCRPRPLRKKRLGGRNMSFDPMAAAIDWLGAYRAGDIEGSLRMYADDAVVRCDCGGTKTITGKERLRAYWLERLR